MIQLPKLELKGKTFSLILWFAIVTGISLNGDLIHNTLSLLYRSKCHGSLPLSWKWQLFDVCKNKKLQNAKDGSWEAEADVVRWWCGD